MPTNLSYIAKVGGTSSGTGETTFNSPRGITTDGTHLWIADSGNHRIKKLMINGLGFVAHYGDLDSLGAPTSGSGNTGFSSPRDVWYYDGHVFVADGGNNRIKIHRATDFKFIKSFGSLSNPFGLSGSRNSLFVADYGNSRIVKYNLPGLDVAKTFGSSGSGNNNLSQPNQIAYDNHEKVLYIADNGNNRLLKWDAVSGTYRDKSTIASISGVAIKDYFLYIGALSAIKVYDPSTLTQQTTAGSSGTGNTNISSTGYILPYRNLIIFTDLGNHRLMVWYNYRPARAFDSGDSPVIEGEWFENPNIPIGGKQFGEIPVDAGTSQKDLLMWNEEDQQHNAIAWVKE